MTKEDSVQYYIEILQKMDKDDIISIPFIWSKDDLEDLYGKPFGDTEWLNIVEKYNHHDGFCEDSITTMIDIAAQEVGGYPE